MPTYSLFGSSIDLPAQLLPRASTSQKGAWTAGTFYTVKRSEAASKPSMCLARSRNTRRVRIFGTARPAARDALAYWRELIEKIRFKVQAGERAC
jgi:hypothetical protein